MQLIQSLNKEITRSNPKRRSALANIIIKRLFNKGSFEIHILNVCFESVYRGVRVEIRNLENNEVYELPSKEDVYSVAIGNQMKITI